MKGIQKVRIFTGGNAIEEINKFLDSPQITAINLAANGSNLYLLYQEDPSQ